MSNKIYKILESIIKVTDAEISEVQEIADGQKAYCHPFKMTVVDRQNRLGEYNTEVLRRLTELRDYMIHNRVK